MATVRIDELTRTTINAFIQDTREHGIFNTKFTAINNSTTEQSMGIDLSSSSYDINCAVRKAGASGDVEWLSSAAAIKITLSTGTVTGTIAGITVTGAYDLYGYVISNNGTMIFGLSRSPYHKSVPANYIHTNTASARTIVAAGATAWDAMWISLGTTINATNSCVCLGLVGTVTLDSTNGRASASTLATGALPSWDKVLSNGWVSGVPTFTGFGTVSSLTYYSKLDNDGTLWFDVTVTSGTATATEARMSLAHGIDTKTSATTYGTSNHVCVISSSENQSDYVLLIEANKGYLTFGTRVAGSTNPLTKQNGNAIYQNGSILSFRGFVRVQ